MRCADGFGARNGRDMLTALWPATLGYFLSQMMASVFTPAQIETARQYVLANAIPRGPLPAFSVGKTPYGVLPVTSLRRYPTEPFRESPAPSSRNLVTFVLRLWPNWLGSSDFRSAHAELAAIPMRNWSAVLGMDASSMTFRGRKVLGDDFLWNYALFNGITPAGIQHLVDVAPARGTASCSTTSASTPWDPRVIHLGMENASFPVPFPTVQAAPRSRKPTRCKADADLGGGKKGNYIQWLQAGHGRRHPGGKLSRT